MCGICGIFGQGDKSVIPAMMAAIEHRGSDDHGSFADDACGLGHQRLAILDLSERGRQPVSNENGTVWTVVNGEIYNYRSLRLVLTSKGHLFRSDSDSEVVVHAYEEYGDDFLDKLRGMFALAVYDQNKRRLMLARDPMGKKPLYYAQRHDGSLLFASEVKGVLAGGAPCRINYNAISSWLRYQYTAGEQTLFLGVKKLLAGHRLIATENSTSVSRYWGIREGNNDDPYPVRRLQELLDESVHLRLQADVPVGSFLSGGIDSSAITALYRRHYSGKLHTFTATFKEHSEAKYARAVSQHLGTEYHEIEITPSMVARDLAKVTWHHDEPLGDAAVLNNYYLAQEAKKYVTVVLAGEGGDEVFGGYPWHGYTKRIHWLNRLPAVVKDVSREILRGLEVGDVTSRLYPMGRLALLACQNSLDDALLYPTTATSELTTDWLLSYGNAFDPEPVHPDGVSDPYNRMLALDCLNLLPEKFLMKADKATMAFAVEERLPLLDKEVVQYAFTLPPKLKRNKYILRKAVEDLLPRDIVWRPKMGFGTPLATWLSDSRLKELAKDRLNNGALLKSICRKEPLEKIAGLLDGKVKPSSRVALSPVNMIWTLLALQVWHDVWFGDREEVMG